MHINESPLLEKLMNGKCNQGANAEHRLKRIGTGPQMGDGAQVFQAVPFFLHRIIRRGFPFDYHTVRLNLKGLFRLRRFNQRACNDECTAYIQSADPVKIIQPVSIDDLQRFKK